MGLGGGGCGDGGGLCVKKLEANGSASSHGAAASSRSRQPNPTNQRVHLEDALLEAPPAVVVVEGGWVHCKPSAPLLVKESSPAARRYLFPCALF
jgi:hypothetical protein